MLTVDCSSFGKIQICTVHGLLISCAVRLLQPATKGANLLASAEVTYADLVLFDLLVMLATLSSWRVRGSS